MFDDDEEPQAHLSSFTIDPVTIRYSTDGLGELVVQRLTDRLAEEILGQVKEQYVEKLDAMISERVGSVLEQAFAQPLFKTDQWGGRKGEPVSLNELLIEQASKHLSEPVDQWGAYSIQHHPRKTRLQWTFDKALESALGQPLKDEIAKAVSAAKEQAAKNIGQMLVAAASKLT